MLEHNLVFKGRGRSKMQVKIKNLASGHLLSETFHTGDNFEEAELEKKRFQFVYSNRDKFVFSAINDKSKRTELAEAVVGQGAQFLKTGQAVEAMIFDDKIISIVLPVKVCLKVVESPPGVRAGRAEAGAKQVVLETGCKINAPLFIKNGDIIEINTSTGVYTRRVE